MHALWARAVHHGQYNPAMRLRAYDHDRDLEAVRRIWRESGWLEDIADENALEHFVTAGPAVVAEVDGQAECLTCTFRGQTYWLDTPLPMCAVTSVNASRVVRKRGFASRVTARAIAEDAANGAAVANLGIFDQGYYDRLGFGTGSYERLSTFDPAALTVPVPRKAVRRLTKDDWQIVHANRRQNLPTHGACPLDTPAFLRFQMSATKNAFGLGFDDPETGELSHHVWCRPIGSVEYGPYRIGWTAYRTAEQFRDLVGLIRGLGDQIMAATMAEPPGIQLQALLKQPFRRRELSKDSKYRYGEMNVAFWQARICDMKQCIEAVRVPGEAVSFNLELSDPIEAHLDDNASWRGVGGQYVITLGPESSVRRGTDKALPTMTTGVGTFTRLWLGVAPATGLAATDPIDAPLELLQRLDRLLRLPTPMRVWDF